MEDNEKVICRINDEWSITFQSHLYDFLKKRFGDVHLWAKNQYELIVLGEMQFATFNSSHLRERHQLSQRAIGDLIRAYGVALWVASIDDL